MPIKDQQTRREYFKEYMANRRKGLTVKPNDEGLTNPNPVKPENKLNLVKPTEAQMLNPELVKPVSVKPEPVLLNPDLVVKPLEAVKPIQDNSVKPEVVKPTENVKPVKPQPIINQRITNPTLTQLIHQYQTETNYNCASSCKQGKYCSNCWYFAEDKLIDYKGGKSM